MKRRLIFALALAVLSALALATAPWTVSSSALVAEVARQLREDYGLDLTADGRTTIAFLPVPRLKVEAISIANPEGRELVQGGSLRGELRIWPLLAGRLVLSEISLAQSRIDVARFADGRTTWDGILAKLRERAARPGGAHIARLVLSDARVVLDGGRGKGDLASLSLVATWPGAAGELDVAGVFTWRGEPVEIAVAGLQPAKLAAGGASPLVARLTAPAGRVLLTGQITHANGPDYRGRTLVQTRSLQDLRAWTGLDLPLGGLPVPLSIDGEARIGGDGLAWSAATLTLGPDALIGALALRLDGDRPAISGTLAAETLNLTPFLRPLLGDGEGGLDLQAATPANLDLRISTAAAQLDRTRLDDLALSVLARPGRIEASLGRASLHRGVVKGRLTLASAAEGVDLKMQGAFERVDLGALLTELGEPRWLGGIGQGQIALEGLGATGAELRRSLHGRVTATLRAGDLAGVALADLPRRAERRPLAAAADWRGGKTTFEQASLTLAVAEGAADIADGTVQGPGWRAGLTGRASLRDRTLDAAAAVEGVPPGPGPVRLRIVGPWREPTLALDAPAPDRPRPGEPPRAEAAAQ